MTHARLTLDSVTHVLPDGRTLFSNLSESFDDRHAGLVGRNGVGKSVLARILAGELQPTAGRCLQHGRVHHLRQQVRLPDGLSVAGLMGVHEALDALRRIEAGSNDVADFESVGDRWDLRQQLQQALRKQGLDGLDPQWPAHRLSGGEAMRVALAGAMLADADFLLLDEPSNHLDRAGRRVLADALHAWPGGLLVISHDRELLETMERIVELSPSGLRSYGGGYGRYAELRAHETSAAQEQLAQRKLERRREMQALLRQRERLEQRLARGQREGREANQAPILLGLQKARAQGASGKLRRQQDAARDRLDMRVRDAAAEIDAAASISLHAVDAVVGGRRKLVELEDVVLPFVEGPTQRISLQLQAGQRIAVCGRNGCGKSTLLQVIAGTLAPVSGECRRQVAPAWLDQGLSGLDPAQGVIAQLRAANPAMTEDALRLRLVHLGLDADRVALPSGSLSGGERLKAALACVLYAEQPPELLLLDEPGNHLDLPSMQALETMLRDYRGALVVVSHDEALLGNLALDARLEALPEGWRLL